MTKVARWTIAGGLLLICVTILLAAQPKPKPGEVNTPPARGERPPERLKVGDAAPDFTLADPAGKKEMKLSSFQNKKPVVLIFGSHT